ncbi:GNAT family N-acetyltransferase [Agromyces allii]|uniref:N-acetyltransferase domain-containing protein n=1 Tax=Agromyces allii TaxID=393607 RepID=A0ABN2R9K2_9MICO|nr:GNAT family N-acetyltransferase [Agromyces allii]
MAGATAFTIRAARPEEYPAVAALTDRAFAAGPYGHLPVSAERRALVNAVAERAADGAVLVAVETASESESERADAAGSRLLGTVSVVRAASPQSRLAVGDEAELRLLAVAPEARGRGLGEALALAAQEEALTWGSPAVVLDTGTLNHTSQRLYERLGYERFTSAAPVPTTDAAASEDRIDHIDYRLPLRDREDLVVRLVRDDEIDAVAALSVRAYEYAYELSDEYRASIADVAPRAVEHQVWVAADATTGELLGSVATPRRGSTISPLAQPGELDFRLLAVDPPARGRGVGEELTRLAIELARLRGLDRVVMNSGPQMTGAHRLYAKLGFDRLHDREREIVDGDRRFLLLAFTIDVPRATRSIAA